MLNITTLYATTGVLIFVINDIVVDKKLHKSAYILMLCRWEQTVIAGICQQQVPEILNIKIIVWTLLDVIIVILY